MNIPVSIFNWFAKITGWPVQFLCFRTSVVFEDRSVQGRRIKGPAIIVSNHTSVYDYAVWLFVFASRTLRVPMAEILFEKQPLALFLKMMGGIKIDRNAHSIEGVAKCEEILRDGGVVLMFPEGRLPRKGEATPLGFRPGAAALALSTGAKIIPVYTDGSYFRKNRARTAVGIPFYASEAADPALPMSENLKAVSSLMRSRVVAAGELLSAGGGDGNTKGAMTDKNGDAK